MSANSFQGDLPSMAAKRPVNKGLHECPMPGCGVRIAREMAFCGNHWWLIPKEIKKSIWREFRAAPGSAGHLGAIQLGIEALTHKPRKEAA